MEEKRIEYFSVFGGFDCIDLELVDGIEKTLINLLENYDTSRYFPFFILDDPFKRFLIKLAKSDGKMYSLFKRVGIGEKLGLDIIKELIDNDILYVVKSREKPLKDYPKQKIKKELKYYEIEPKIYFKKPFYRFWFAFVVSNIDNRDFKESVIRDYNRFRYRLTSLVFEQLSIEVLKEYFKDRDDLVEVGSFWDVNSEFDIYCKTKNGEILLGECKYKNRPVIHSELLKLKSKAKYSNLDVDRYVLFSKAGFSQELIKDKSSNLLLFDLSSLDTIID